VKAICKRADERGSETERKPGSGRPKTARTEENIKYLKLLISENRTLTLMLRHFTKYWVNWIKLNWLAKTYVMNKCGKLCVKMFLRYIDIAIFTLAYFILPHPHPVDCYCCVKEMKMADSNRKCNQSTEHRAALIERSIWLK